MKTTQEQGDTAEPQQPTAQREMPRYKCHKEVHALKIAALEPDAAMAILTNA
jgi:hypothetical protein